MSSLVPLERTILRSGRLSRANGAARSRARRPVDGSPPSQHLLSKKTILTKRIAILWQCYQQKKLSCYNREVDMCARITMLQHRRIVVLYREICLPTQNLPC